MPQSLGQFVHSRRRRGQISSGSADVDALLDLNGHVPVELIGPPGAGKSSLCVRVALDAARSGGRVRWILGRLRPFPLRHFQQSPGFHPTLLSAIEVVPVVEPDTLALAGPMGEEILVVVDHWDEIMPSMGLGIQDAARSHAKVAARAYTAKLLAQWARDRPVIVTGGVRPWQGTLISGPLPPVAWRRVTMARDERAQTWAWTLGGHRVLLGSRAEQAIPSKQLHQSDASNELSSVQPADSATAAADLLENADHPSSASSRSLQDQLHGTLPDSERMWDQARTPPAVLDKTETGPEPICLEYPAALLDTGTTPFSPRPRPSNHPCWSNVDVSRLGPDNMHAKAHDAAIGKTCSSNPGPTYSFCLLPALPATDSAATAGEILPALTQGQVPNSQVEVWEAPL